MRIKVIVNPGAGRRIVQKELEAIVGRLLVRGIAEDISVTATHGQGDACRAAAALRPGEYDLIIACGGDGTVNEIVQGLMESRCHIPMAILAAGTSNDFAVCLGLPHTAAAFVDMIQKGEYQPIDVGRANGSYFINVAAFGMFTEIAHKTDREAKGILGKLAYYLTGVREAPHQLPTCMPVHIRSAEMEMEDEIRLCLIGNSRTVATMPRILHRAELNDGKFDVFILRKLTLLNRDKPLGEYITSGEILRDPATVYFQTDHIEIDSPEAARIELDCDGEYRGHLPLTLDVCHNAVELLIPADAKQKGLFRLPEQA